MHVTKDLLLDIEKDPFAILQTMTTKDIASVIKIVNQSYHNDGKQDLSDVVYDIILDYLKKLDPSHPLLNGSIIGALPSKNKVKLPFYMGSLNKVRDDDAAIAKWQSKLKGSYIISDKLDGISCLFYKKAGILSLFSRGDGNMGQDISHLLSFIQIPDIPPNDIVIRGELIFTKKDWNEHIKSKRTTARNTVAGLANSKKPDSDIAKYVKFVAYELIEPMKTPQEGLKYLQSLGFQVVYHELHSKFDNDSLSKILVTRRSDSPYEIDGIVVKHNSIHDREIDGNPDYAFAFKSILTHESAEVIVQKIQWNVSKAGALKPVVLFDEVFIDGAHIRRATGHNAQYIKENNIGPGSHILIIRSGSVIPYIKQVLQGTNPSLPDKIEYDWKWNESGVDIVLKDPSLSHEYHLKQLENYATVLAIKGLGTKTLKKLYEKGIDSVKKLINITKVDLYKATLSSKITMKVYKQMQEIYSNSSCVDFMIASNIFGNGFGKTKLALIVSSFPETLNYEERHLPTLTQLTSIKGVGERFARIFIDKIYPFYDFVEETGIPCRSSNKNVEPTPEGCLCVNGKNIVFTGFRSKDLEDLIIRRGGYARSSVSTNTHIVVAKSEMDNSIKTELAKELGIPIMTLATFKDEVGFIEKHVSNTGSSDVEELRAELEKEGIVMDENEALEDEDEDEEQGTVLTKRAECIRNMFNWTNMKHSHIFGKVKYNEQSVLDDITLASPKLEKLIKKIKDLDNKDVAEHGHTFKHMIFSDVTKRGYGAKIIGSALFANGYKHAYNSNFDIHTGIDHFAILASTQIYAKPISIEFKHKLLQRFNARPRNVFGDDIRIIVLDTAYKEGIDLFDVKYVHLFEPLLNYADEQQAIGRATRLCGQKGLHFEDGWKVHVYKYDYILTEQMKDNYKGSTSVELIFNEINRNVNLIKLSRKMEDLCKKGSIDSELTKVFAGGSGDKVASPTSIATPMKHQDLMKWVKQTYSDMKWPPMKNENLCKNVKNNNQLLEFTPTQKFIRQYFQPSTQQKGILLFQGLGTGKTCTALATASLSWEVEGYTIIWVTRSTLRMDLYKNMFEQSCVERVRDYVHAGNIMPDDLNKQKRLLSKSWIPAVSYRQFNNTLHRSNRLYDYLIKKNGLSDPLKKTLLIIDEVHLMTSPTMKEKDKPDIQMLNAWLQNSYKVSKENSARIILMSATPIVDDPMDFMRLLNLTSRKHYPDDLAHFCKRYLENDSDLTFTKQGEELFMEDFSGRISYLNRAKDIRQFAQPVLHDVRVNVSNSDHLLKIQGEMDSIANEIEELKGQTKIAETKRRMLQELDTEYQERIADCKDDKKCIKTVKDEYKGAKVEIDGKARTLVEEKKVALESIKLTHKQAKEKVKEAKKNDISITTFLEKRCYKKTKTPKIASKKPSAIEESNHNSKNKFVI